MKKLLFTLFILTASCLMLLTACTECEVCSFGDWETVTEATCTAEGEKVRICSECQKEDRQPIEKKEHDLSLKETTLAATCTTEGKETWGCANCDYTEERTVKATGHKETKAVIVEATCTQEGKDTYTCSICNNVREITHAKYSHRYTDATCKKPATCTVCGATSGEKADHTYSDATCTEPKKCTSCGATSGKALGHSTSSGECSRCGERISRLSQCTFVFTDKFPLTLYDNFFSGDGAGCAEIQSVTEVEDVQRNSFKSYEIVYKIIKPDLSNDFFAKFVVTDPQGVTVNSGSIGEINVEPGQLIREKITVIYEKSLSTIGQYKITFKERN